jgi:hypothetical protein
MRLQSAAPAGPCAPAGERRRLHAQGLGTVAASQPAAHSRYDTGLHAAIRFTGQGLYNGF